MQSSYINHTRNDKILRRKKEKRKLAERQIGLRRWKAQSQIITMKFPYRKKFRAIGRRCGFNAHLATVDRSISRRDRTGTGVSISGGERAETPETRNCVRKQVTAES